MMRPVKLGGDQLMFGEGCLEHLKSLGAKRAYIVNAGKVMEENGILGKVKACLEESGAEVRVFMSVEPDPKFKTVLKGKREMEEFQPDWIVALGGGSAMDAAKAMWVFYENPELSSLSDIVPPNKIPSLRKKARLACLPTTAGTASEVSRSIVITDDETNIKYGIGDMIMMPDVAICDPALTVSMPKSITAQTGLDALCHAVEAYVSTRAHFLSDILAKEAVKSIFSNIKTAYESGSDINARENMLNASTIAGMAFTNVSLGITHSIAHTIGSYFGLPHGLLNGVIMPIVIKFNSKNEKAKKRYECLAESVGEKCLADAVLGLATDLMIPKGIGELVDKEKFKQKLEEMAEMALSDGCTKTNPIIPTKEEMKELFLEVL